MGEFVPTPEACDWAAGELVRFAGEVSVAMSGGSRPAQTMIRRVLLSVAGNFAERGSGELPGAFGLILEDAERQAALASPPVVDLDREEWPA